jgi:hypothetical protein
MHFGPTKMTLGDIAALALVSASGAAIAYCPKIQPTMISGCAVARRQDSAHD